MNQRASSQGLILRGLPEGQKLTHLVTVLSEMAGRLLNWTLTRRCQLPWSSVSFFTEVKHFKHISLKLLGRVDVLILDVQIGGGSVVLKES